MSDSPKKVKSTLESLLSERQVMTGRDLIKRRKTQELEAACQKAILDEAIEFEKRNRRNKA